MGDFELTPVLDLYNFTYSIDGSAASPLFSSVIDVDGMQDYTLEGGETYTLDDPVLCTVLDDTENSILLNNNFQNISADLFGTGSTLEITFTAQSDGGSEAFAFRNLIIEGGMGGEPLPADFNKDGLINGNDFLIWQQNFPTAENATSNTGDADGDGAVDGNDFLIWQSSFGTGSGSGASVPEPTCLVLMALCCCGLLGRRNRS